MNHDTLRHLADSWGLVLLCAIFAVALWMALRPGARPAQDRAKMIPLLDQDD